MITSFARGQYLSFAASSTSGFATFPPTQTFKMANVMNLMCSPDETQTDTSRSTDDKQINSISRDLNPDQRTADGLVFLATS